MTENKDFNEVMDLLNSIPGVKDHLEKIQVKLGKEILKIRLELGLTHANVVEACKTFGKISIDESKLSQMESGDLSIEENKYKQIYDFLRLILDLFSKYNDKYISQKKSNVELEESPNYY
jgi:transcriptional regulator with XRE-family HTH domain